MWNRIQELVRLSDQYTTYIDTVKQDPGVSKTIW
jgi:hypothetical protein